MLRITRFIAIASLLCTSSGYAGFYLGVAAGPEGARFTQKSRVARAGTFDVRDKEHFSGDGVFGSIFAGYGWLHNQFYLAGEVNANISSLEYYLSNAEYIHQTFSRTTFTVKTSQGISVLPGYMIADNTLVYGRIGYANGRLRIRESDPTIQSQTKNRSGIRYGLGIRRALTPHLALMMDYSQINYRSVKSYVFEPFGEVSKRAKISADTAQVAFGLIYNFDAPQQQLVK